ncbi:MAG: putative maltokinase, partial [Kofleriaceae bacterium]
RRLAPLLGVRRKVELMNALLLSLPGTPVLYYGDEIGMGDNIYLGDRDGVRTPMQWSSDRNGGFSRANPQKLYLPTIIDPDYHYEAVNVEAQQRIPSSLLWFTKRLLAKRKEHRLFGRGSIEFITSDNPRVLAFVREYEGETVLVVANLSRFVQAVWLSLERFKGMVPTELYGRMKFPEVTDAAYFMSLGPHDFYWLALDRPQGAESAAERPPLIAKASWTALFEPARRMQLARALLSYATQRRWFRSKARTRKQVAISDVVTFGSEARYAIALLQIEYDHGPAETYVMPLAFAEDAEPAETTRTPSMVIARVALSDVPERGAVSGVLYDALSMDSFNTMLLAAMTSGTAATGRAGSLGGTAFAALHEAASAAPLAARATVADQSNSGVLYGDRFLLKLFRAIEEGPSAELEVGRFLASRAPDYHGVPQLAGVLEYQQPGHEPSTLGTLFAFVANQGDAWHLALDSLDRYFDRVLADEQRPETPPVDAGSLVEQSRIRLADRVVDWIGPFVDRIRLLGRRTADLHLALASAPNDPLFAPEPYDIMHQQSVYGSAVAYAARTFDQVRGRLGKLTPEQRTLAETVVGREADVDRVLSRITRRRIDLVRTRIHGDYHLGQVLWTGDDFSIIDFEGEPGRPLSQRRFKRSPLRDVAGMLRSLRYASAAALRSGRHRPEDMPRLDGWARAWSGWVSAAFLAGYLERAHGTRIVPPSDADLTLVLEFFLLEKCVYEIGYELNNRPDWLEIPLRALLELLPAEASP